MRIAANRGFTLIEFVLVMALLATLMALAAPRLAGSLRHRKLDQEATRIVALVEYARDEAVSQGIPMTVWLDTDTSRFGMQPRSGFTLRSARVVEYRLSDDVRFDLGRSRRGSGVQSAVQLATDGVLEADSLEELWLEDRSGDRVGVVLMTNGWGYEVVQEQDYARRLRSTRR